MRGDRRCCRGNSGDGGGFVLATGSTERSGGCGIWTITCRRLVAKYNRFATEIDTIGVRVSEEYLRSVDLSILGVQVVGEEGNR